MTAYFADLPASSKSSGGREGFDVISSGQIASEPLKQGLAVIGSLMQSTNSVLFSILPTGLTFHAASGDGSGRLAASLSSHAAALDSQVQGPVVLGGRPHLVGDLEGPTLGKSPVPNVYILAERRHREKAFGLAVSYDNPSLILSATRVRFAHTLFRDLASVSAKGNRPQQTRDHSLKARWQKFQFSGLVGGSKQMLHLFSTIRKLARSDVNVLVLGESGTGKELVARAIHEHSDCVANKFVAQNCAALPESLLESELFGHCKGAFTGANLEKRGLFEEANGGTFFLDEIADMPLMLQIKMLRVIQDGVIRKLGETKTSKVSVRIIAATHKNLADEVSKGHFREDLFHRLNVVRLELPTLRTRRDDIPILARYFCDKIRQRMGCSAMTFSEETLRRFIDYDWPGNVRELENEIERLVALYGDEKAVQPYMLSERLRYGNGVDWSLHKLEEIQDLHRATEYLERALIARSLERHAWNKSRAAVELGVSRQGLIKKIKRLDLVRPGNQCKSPGHLLPHSKLKSPQATTTQATTTEVESEATDPVEIQA